tara:strand:- start:956 stop:1489 length:534 start_codon:yes stop_codon:yes gene_type:complete
MTNLTNQILSLESHINLTEAAPMNTISLHNPNETTSPEVGLVDYEHVNLNTEAAPMTIITDTTDLAESREAFGDDYVMYCDWCASLYHPTAKVVPVSKEIYFNLTEAAPMTIMTNTTTKEDKLILKAMSLYQAHRNEDTPVQLATNIVFEYVRELGGYDLAEHVKSCIKYSNSLLEA